MNILNQPVFYLIGGPNGAGKSTVAKHEVLPVCPGIVSINWDDTVKEVYENDDYKGRRDRVQIGNILRSKMQKAFSTQSSIVEETTLSGCVYKEHIKLAQKAGYELRFLYVALDSVEQSIKRVSERAKQGGHNVPEADIRRRYERSLLHFEEICKMSDSWKVYYNGGTHYELLACGVKETIENVTPLFNTIAKALPVFDAFQQANNIPVINTR